jgi:hypothetical protein
MSFRSGKKKITGKKGKKNGEEEEDNDALFLIT